MCYRVNIGLYKVIELTRKILTWQNECNLVWCNLQFLPILLLYCNHLAHANATSAAAAFSLWIWVSSGFSCVTASCSLPCSNHEHRSPSKPLRQSAGSLPRLSGWQSRRQASSTSAVTPASAGSWWVCDCRRGKMSSKPTRDVKGAWSELEGSGGWWWDCWYCCCRRPWRFRRVSVSSSPPDPVPAPTVAPSRSCCSSRATCRCAPHKPRRALSRYSRRRA